MMTGAQRASVAAAALAAILAGAIGLRALRSAGSFGADARGFRCDRGDMNSCVSFGNDVEESDPGRALALYRKACAQGVMLGCSREGDLLRDGRGAEQDLERAAELFARACQGREGHGCANLGSLHQEGKGVPLSLPMARRFMEDGCKLGAVYSCLLLASLLEQSPTDAAALVGAHERACDLGSSFGCRRAAQGLACERGVERGFERAARLMAKACRAKDEAACDQLLGLYLAGAMPDSAERAPEYRKLRQRAAARAIGEGNEEESQRRLAALREEGAVDSADFLAAIHDLNAGALETAAARLEALHAREVRDPALSVLRGALAAVRRGEQSWTNALVASWAEEGRPDVRDSVLMPSPRSEFDAWACFDLGFVEPVELDGSVPSFLARYSQLLAHRPTTPDEPFLEQALKLAFSGDERVQVVALGALVSSKVSPDQRLRAHPVAVSIAELLASKHPENLYFVGAHLALLLEYDDRPLLTEEMARLESAKSYRPPHAEIYGLLRAALGPRGSGRAFGATIDALSWATPLLGSRLKQLGERAESGERDRVGRLLMTLGKKIADGGWVLEVHQGAALQRHGSKLTGLPQDEASAEEAVARGRRFGARSLLAGLGEWPLVPFTEEWLARAADDELGFFEGLEILAGLADREGAR